MTKKFKIITLICLILCSAANIVFAADIKFEVSLDKDKIAIGETAQLGLSFQGTQSMPAPDIGNIAGLEVRYIGPSTMMTVINGQVSSSVTHMYTILPLRVGKFQLGPFSFKYKGNNYTSGMAFLDVSTERVAPKEAAPEAILEKMNLEDRLFVTLEIGKQTAFVNELIPVKVKFYVYRLNVSDIQLPVFSQEGFSKIEFKEPKQYRENLNGTIYEVLEFATNIFGTRPGDYKIGPAKIKCNLVVRRKAARSSMDDMFDEDRSARDSFFDDFLARYEKHPLELKSQEAALIVSPLPQEGRPADFKGAVGDYQFIYKASPVTVKTGDPVTVRMSINGTGNFNTVLEPRMDGIEGFKVYEPEVKTEGNSKEFTQVLIPESTACTETPRATFVYFDPGRKQYITIAQGPIPIQVEKGKEESSRVIGPAAAAEKAEESEREDLGRDIVYIKESPGRWAAKGHDIYRARTFLLVVAIPLVFLLSTYLIQKRIRKIKTDTVYASRLNALKAAKGGMKRLKEEQNSEDPKIFYEALFKTLHEYLGNRLYMPTAGITFDEVKRALMAKEVDMDIIRKVRNLFDACDEARFAFLKTGRLKMRDDMKELEDIIRYLERKRI
ncbi:MAG: BatD family protein [Candidatus Omnitrophica bacterium]|nr:BatD family protein [Candidatus Omnitrophota bacterium]